MRPQQFTWVLAATILFAASAGFAKPPARVEIKEAVLNYTALQPGQQAVAAVVLEIKPGFHAQSHTPSDPNFIPFEAAFDKSLSDKDSMLKVFGPVYPPGKSETYRAIDASKPLNIYSGTVVVYLPFEVKADAKSGALTLAGALSYQVCDDNACYPPAETPFSIETKVLPLTSGEAVHTQRAELFKNLDPTIFSRTAHAPTTAPAPVEKGETLLGGFTLRHNSYLLAFAAAFIAGIIFNAVPCVLPVLPLKAIGFYEVSRHNRARCLAYGAVFSFGLIASFGVLALIVVVYHVVGWGEIYSNVWFNIAIVLILLVMAIGTFGAFSVNLPTAVYNVTPRHDTYTGNFLFGILTAVLSTPCTFGLFVGLLAWVKDQPSSVGVPLIMTVGAGMAFPYFLLSAFPEVARRFPRTGPWSDVAKQLMAFLLLGSAVFFARRFITPWAGAQAFWWILFAVAAVAGLFLLARTFQLSNHPGPRMAAAVAAALIIGGTFILVRQLVNQPYQWEAYSAEQLEAGRKANRVVVVEFTAAWCSTCQYLEVHTLNEKGVVETVKKRDAQMLRADLTSASADGWALLKQVAPFPAIPFTIVYGPGLSQPTTLTGIYSPQDLRDAIDHAARTTLARR